MDDHIRIYNNDRCLFFTNDVKKLLKGEKITNASIVQRMDDIGNMHQLYEDFLITEFENLIFHIDPEKGKEFFINRYKMVLAAGGVVQSDQNEILLIYRHNIWDLPKGKLDEGETIQECALREVMEETGLLNIDLGDRFLKTYHMYLMGNEMVIKETHWYEMFSNDRDLTGSTSEGIKKVLWVHRNNLLQHVNKSYRNIKYIMKPWLIAN